MKYLSNEELNKVGFEKSAHRYLDLKPPHPKNRDEESDGWFYYDTEFKFRDKEYQLTMQYTYTDGWFFVIHDGAFEIQFSNVYVGDYSLFLEEGKLGRVRATEEFGKVLIRIINTTSDEDFKKTIGPRKIKAMVRLIEGLEWDIHFAENCLNESSEGDFGGGWQPAMSDRDRDMYYEQIQSSKEEIGDYLYNLIEAGANKDNFNSIFKNTDIQTDEYLTSSMLEKLESNIGLPEIAN